MKIGLLIYGVAVIGLLIGAILLQGIASDQSHSELPR